MSFRRVPLSFQQTWSTKSHQRRMTLPFDQTCVLSMDKTSSWASSFPCGFFFLFPYELIDIPNTHTCAQNSLLWKHASVRGLCGIKNEIVQQTHFTSKVSSRHVRQPDNFYAAWSELNVTGCEPPRLRFVVAKEHESQKARPDSLGHVTPRPLERLPLGQPSLRGLTRALPDNGRSLNNWSAGSLRVTQFPLHPLRQPDSFLFACEASSCDSEFSHRLASQKACLRTCTEHTHVSTLSYRGLISPKPFLIFNIWGESWLCQHSISSSQSVTD